MGGEGGCGSGRTVRAGAAAMLQTVAMQCACYRSGEDRCAATHSIHRATLADAWRHHPWQHPRHHEARAQGCAGFTSSRPAVDEALDGGDGSKHAGGGATDSRGGSGGGGGGGDGGSAVKGQCYLLRCACGRLAQQLEGPARVLQPAGHAQVARGGRHVLRAGSTPAQRSAHPRRLLHHHPAHPASEAGWVGHCTSSPGTAGSITAAGTPWSTTVADPRQQRTLSRLPSAARARAACSTTTLHTLPARLGGWGTAQAALAQQAASHLQAPPGPSPSPTPAGSAPSPACPAQGAHAPPAPPPPCTPCQRGWVGAMLHKQPRKQLGSVPRSPPQEALPPPLPVPGYNCNRRASNPRTLVLRTQLVSNAKAA